MRLPALLDSMTSRIFLILLIGIAAAGTLGLSLSEQRRVSEVRHIQAIRAIERTAAFLGELENTPGTRRQHEAREARRFVRLARVGDAPAHVDGDLQSLLKSQVPSGIDVAVASIPVERCDIASDDEHGDPDTDQAAARAWKAVVAATDCWRITARLRDGSVWGFVTGPPPLLKAAYGPDPAFLVVIAIAAAVLAFVVARIAGAPIRQLTEAAARLEPHATPPDLREGGPSDVRGAIRAYNAMQQRLARHAAEQTHMLAAITHDLQTPMTRMRLKLEQMDGAALQGPLLADWRAMRAVVEEGLELARSTHSGEQPVLLDIDSLIDSIVEDERAGGHDATFAAAAGRDWRCPPQMLRRCVQNLVDNAINYGGAARLSTVGDANALRIEVRDFGPGIPEDQLEAVFEPMVRLEQSRSRSTGGTGLGLTIARNLAYRMGATLTLANAPDGGLLCTLTLGARAGAQGHIAE